jgi:hypothetical protein
MKRTNGSRNHGQGSSRKVWSGMDHNKMRESERLQGRNSRDGSEGSYKKETGEDDSNLKKQGYSGKFEDENRWQHYSMDDQESSDSTGERGMSEKSREKQDKGVYSTISEDDIRSELDYRSNNGGTGRSGRGSDLMDEDHKWRMTENNQSTSNKEKGNGNQKSTGSGSRTGKRKRITHD